MTERLWLSQFGRSEARKAFQANWRQMEVVRVKTDDTIWRRGIRRNAVLENVLRLGWLLGKHGGWEGGSQPFWHQGPISGEDNVSTDWGGGWFQNDSSALYFCALYFYYYYINSTSDHQALDPRGWGPLPVILNPTCLLWPGIPPSEQYFIR